MKKLIIKILIKLIGDSILGQVDLVDQSALNKWLYVSYKDNGWKQYYTLRKRSLLNLLSLGIEKNNEYWQIVGRMKELQALSVNITDEIRRREKSIKVKKD
jgi:hypothetical protein